MAEFRIDTTANRNKTSVDIAPMADGGFYVVWLEQLQFGGDIGEQKIMGQRFSETGEKVGSAIIFDDNARGGTVATPYVATAASGWYAVSWIAGSISPSVGNYYESADTQPYAIRFDTSGTANSANPMLPSPLTGYYGLVDAGDYNFIMGTIGTTTVGNGILDTDVSVPSGTDRDWEMQDDAVGGLIFATRVRTTAPGNPYVFEITRYDSLGQLISGGTTFQETTRVDLWDLAIGPHGRYAVVTSQDIRLFSTSDNLLLTLPVLGQTSIDADAVEFLSDGTFVHIWTAADTSGLGIFAQRYSADGVPLAPAFIVNTDQSGDQINPVIEALNDGRFIITWEDRGTQLRADVFDPLLPRVSGTFGPDTLVGTDQAELIVGQSYDDLIVGMGGNDTINGGHGSDTVSYLHSSSSVDVDLAAGIASGGADVGTDTLYLIENAIGSTANDVLRGDSHANRLVGAAGNDLIEGRGGNDTLAPGAGDDVVHGGDGSDTLDYTGATTGMTLQFDNATDGRVFAGDPIGMDTFTGIENILAGEGNDVIGLSDAGIFCDGGGGNDLIFGGDGADTIRGGSGDDLLFGQLGNDTLAPGAGNDAVHGGDGIDTLDYSGATTGMTLQFDNATDGRVFAGDPIGMDTFTGIENILAGDGNDVIGLSDAGNFCDGGGGNDMIFGGHGADTIRGGSGNDLLFGQAGNDILQGGDGDDILYGFAGNDTLYGGHGADIFRRTVDGEGTDFIMDYSFGEGDVIDVVEDPSQVVLKQSGTAVQIFTPDESEVLFQLENWNLAFVIVIV